jgi:hypothetical protein
LEAAHPINFLDTAEPTLNVKLPIAAHIESVLGKDKVSTKIKSYEQFKAFLGKHLKQLFYTSDCEVILIRFFYQDHNDLYLSTILVFNKEKT